MRDKSSAESLGKEGGQRHTQYTHAEDDYKGCIQYDIQKTADNQVIQRVSGIPNRAQDAGAHIKNKDEKNARKVDAQIQNRISHDFGRGVHPGQHGRSKYNAENTDYNTSHD